MKDLIASFPDQLEAGLRIAQSAQLKPSKHPINAILVAGLGGSGIGGTIVADRLRFHAAIPMLTTKDYDLPAWVDQHTLVITCSYSGNTEETLVVAEKAHDAGSHIVTICSGGKLQAFAEKYAYDCILVPGGMPPRACLGYSFIQQLAILAAHQVIELSYIDEIRNIVTLLRTQQEMIKQDAQHIAAHILNKRVVIYAASDKEGMAIRFRQQLNENSKILCHHHIVPEMNHNELVGWDRIGDEAAVLWLRSPSDHERSQYRFEINKEIIAGHTPHQYELRAKGNTYLEHVWYLIHLTDWISVYLADLEGQDPTDIAVIVSLKEALSKK